MCLITVAGHAGCTQWYPVRIKQECGLSSEATLGVNELGVHLFQSGCLEYLIFGALADIPHYESSPGNVLLKICMREDLIGLPARVHVTSLEAEQAEEISLILTILLLQKDQILLSQVGDHHKLQSSLGFVTEPVMLHVLCTPFLHKLMALSPKDCVRLRFCAISKHVCQHV